jgi:hypothetical protein
MFREAVADNSLKIKLPGPSKIFYDETTLARAEIEAYLKKRAEAFVRRSISTHLMALPCAGKNRCRFVPISSWNEEMSFETRLNLERVP